MNSTKTILGVALATMLVSGAETHAALLAHEPFTNAPGAALIGSAAGFGFNGAWQSNSSQGTATNTASGLGYTDGLSRQLVVSGGAGFFQGLTTGNNNMQPVRLFNFSRGTNGTDGVTTWISFIVVRQGPTGSLAGNPYGRGANVPHDLNTGNLQKLAIGNSSSVGSNTVALIPTGSAANCRGDASSTFGGATNFVVVRVDHVVGGNDHAYLFVNPTLGVEPPTSSAGAVWTNSFDFSFDRLRIFAGGQSSAAQPYAELIVDEYRLGESYADVTPYEGAPPVAGLQITNIQSSGASVQIAGTGGTAGGTFHLLASADVTVPATTWSAIATNTFDGNGNFSLSSPVEPGAKFFRIRTASPAGPTGPTWLSQPVSLTVTQGQAAVFSAGADGTAPLTYQWYFNTNTLLSGPGGATLTLNNVQGTNAGSYSVRVSNAGGNITSTQAVLTVLQPPAITTPPQDQSVVESNAVTFSVTVTGTAPLTYQWFFNTNTPIPNATNASYAISSVATNQAGGYSVVVNNNYGAATSVVAMLTVIPANEFVDFSHVGFAANGITLTGGAAGPTVYVGSEAELQSYSDVNAPYTIIITNSFNLTSMDTHIRNNKTVIGSNNIVLSGGGLYLYDATNVIIRNLTITGSPEDGIGLHFSEHVWIDHCTITDSGDGAIDITQESDNVTISWCHIYYSSPSLEHRLASLIASSDADSGTYRTTYHHNWFGTNCQERLPSVRFGRAHIYNNYYNAPGNNYCVRTRKEAECLVQNNFFQSVQNPWEQYITGSGDVQGKLFASGNNVPHLGTANGVTWTGNQVGSEGTRMMIPGTDPVFAPPYSYTLDAAASVPNRVTNHAGANRGPFAP